MYYKDCFSGYHPIINFLYFGLVILFSMIFMHPICLCISLGCSLCYAVNLKGSKALRFGLIYMLPMMLMAALLNPAFNHQGNTILTYLPSGNPLTMESIVYGAAAAMMLGAVITWFTCYTEVITSDKFVYLFGRAIPALSLVLSMTLRFVPKFKDQLLVVTEAQMCMGRDARGGGLFQRLKWAITILSIMVTWALENAVETADSMKSRGYGLAGRTAFSIYSFDERDKKALIWLVFCGAYIAAGYIAGALYFSYYPIIRMAEITVISISFQIIYLALCLTPVIINKMEDLKWQKLQQQT